MTVRRTVAREHGTRARYVFGAFGSDRTQGCRCEPCSAANRAHARFERKRVRLGRDTGRFATPMVYTARAAAHIGALRFSGVGARQTAHLAGLHRSQISDITAGRVRHIRRETEAAILAVPVQPAGGTLVDGTATWVLVDRLLAHGLTRKRIGQAVTANRGALMLQLRRDLVTVRSAQRVEALHWEILGDPANPDRPDLRHFAFAPLAARLVAHRLPTVWLQREVGIHPTRARLRGLNAGQADRAATALGLHAADLWPEWAEDLQATG